MPAYFGDLLLLCLSEVPIAWQLKQVLKPYQVIIRWSFPLFDHGLTLQEASTCTAHVNNQERKEYGCRWYATLCSVHGTK